MGKPVLLLGNKRIQPPGFPVDIGENAGNIVHADAAFKIVKNGVFHTAETPAHPKIENFVNHECSKVVYIFANALKLGDDNPNRFDSTINFLKNTDKQVVSFGLGCQCNDFSEIDTLSLSSSAIEMIKLLSDRSSTIGVRGDFTRRVLEKHGVHNVRVTGCPSLYSGLQPTINVPNASLDKCSTSAYSGTYYFNDEETQLLGYSICNNCTHVEAVSKLMYESSWACKKTTEVDEKSIPYYMLGLVKKNKITIDQAYRYLKYNFKLFRDMPAWQSFNRDEIDFTFGTRFHVNMASLLSGVPALWITHDSRTRELCDFMNLPQLAIDDFDECMPINELADHAKYDLLNTNYPKLYENFKAFLHENEVEHNLQ